MADIADIASTRQLVKERARSFEAQPAPAVDSARALKGKPSPVAERMRERFGARNANADDKRPQVPKRKLSNITEQRVLKAGVRRFHKEMVATQAIDITQLPKHANGKPKVMSVSFFERLLSNRLEIKGCLESDVAAAQPDLRHLSTEQLLALRAETLDFLTESESHNAHNCFLNTVDQHLFWNVALGCLRRGHGFEATPKVGRQDLFEAGLRVTLILGAAEMLANAWDAGRTEALEELPPVPSCWVFTLDEQQWEGNRFAVFNTEKKWLKVTASSLEFSKMVPAEELLGCVHDRSSGVGPTRMLYWEVACLNPRASPVDLLAEIERRSNGAKTAKTSFSSELNQALRSLRSVPNVEQVAASPEIPQLSPRPPVSPVRPQPRALTFGMEAELCPQPPDLACGTEAELWPHAPDAEDNTSAHSSDSSVVMGPSGTSSSTEDEMPVEAPNIDEQLSVQAVFVDADAVEEPESEEQPLASCWEQADLAAALASCKDAKALEAPEIAEQLPEQAAFVDVDALEAPEIKEQLPEPAAFVHADALEEALTERKEIGVLLEEVVRQKEELERQRQEPRAASESCLSGCFALLFGKSCRR